MIQMIREVIQLFRNQKRYLFLLVAIVLFFIFVLFHHQEQAEKPLDPEKQQVEMLLRQGPQDPQEIDRKLANRPVLKQVAQLFTILFMSSFVYGIWLGAIDIKKLFFREELVPRRDRFERIPWGAVEIVKVIILFFSLGIIFNLITAAAKFILSIPIDPSCYMLIHTTLLDLSVVLIIFYLIRRKGAQFSDILGFHWSRLPLDEFWWGLRTYFVILPMFIGLLFAVVYLVNLFSYEPPLHPLVELLEAKNLPTWTVLFSVVIACVIGPIVEEIFFRGFFYPALRKYLGVGWTIVITAGFFAFVHENLFAFIPIFFLGLVLCYLYEKRGSLISCVSLHILHNSAFMAYFFIMKTILLSEA